MHEASNFFESRMNDVVQRNAITYNAAISACERGEEWHQILDLFEGILYAEVQRYIIRCIAASISVQCCGCVIICIALGLSRDFEGPLKPVLKAF